MLLKKKYMEVLEKFKDKEYVDMAELAPGEYEEAEEIIHVLLALELQGLIEPVSRERPREFKLTEAGKKVLEVWEEVGKPDVERWLDSAIHAALWALWRTGAKAPKDWYTPLKERGFLNEDGTINEPAKKLLEQFEPKVRPVKVRVTRDLGWVLAKTPPGLAHIKPLQRFPEEYVDLLEAMGALVFSSPDRKYYALTRFGRYLREAIRELRPVAMEYVLVNMKIVEAVKKLIEGKELTDEEKYLLMNLGYYRDGKPTRAARWLYLAIKELERGEWWATFPIGLTRVDQWVLKTIDHLWKKAETNPELKPTKKLIKYWIENHRDEIGMDEETYKELEFTDYTIGIALYRLEAIRLIDSYEEKGKLIYELTEYGKRLLEVLGQITEVPAHGVKTLVYADRGIPPYRAWIEEAIQWGLMGQLGAGTKAKELVRIARRVKRLPLITKLEHIVLQKTLPTRQSEPIEELVKRVTALGYDEEHVRAAIYWLEMWGAVEIYGNGYVELTEIGDMFKHALVATPPGVATPVHPHFIRVLQVIKELGSYEDLAEIVNRTRLTLGIVKDAIVVAREAKLLGRKDLTGDGELLLEAVKKVQEHVEEWA